MDNVSTTIICSCCLSTDRKLIKINENIKQCFYQIVKDFEIIREVTERQICWECSARLKSMIKFTNQVRNAHRILHDIDKDSNITSLSLLQTCDTSHEYQYTHEEENQNRRSKQQNTFYKDFLSVSGDSDATETYFVDLDEEEREKEKKGKRKKNKGFKNVLCKEIELDDGQIENERKTAASDDQFINAMYKCEKCIKAFPNEGALDDHNLSKHDENLTIRCNICDCGFRSIPAHTYHMNKHFKRYQCKTCKLMFNTKVRLRTHHKKIHANTKYGDGDKIKKKKLSNGSVTCDVCLKVFQWKSSLRKHMETHRIERGQMRKPHCESCGLSFSTSINLKKHVQTSVKHQLLLKLRTLDVQPREDDSPEIQAQREKIASAIKKTKDLYPCPQCDKTFQWRGNLHRHIQNHVARDKGNVKCVPCNRTFSSIATYKQHMRVSMKHNSRDDFKFMCSDCGKKFVDKTRLKDHTNWEHLKKYEHRCNICKKVFKSHTSLYLHHQLVHRTQEPNHLCHLCGKAFATTTKYRCHISTSHVHFKQYQCAHCTTRFSWKSCLSRHIKMVHPNVTVIKDNK